METTKLHRGRLIDHLQLVTRDLDILQELGRRHRVSVHISLASTDLRLIRRLERRSPGPRARLRALATLASGGVSTKLLVAPILPAITDGHIALDHLLRAARDAGAVDANGDALRLGHASRRRFLPLIQREFPHLVERYSRAYGPGRHAPRAYLRALRRRLDLLRARHGFPREP